VLLPSGRAMISDIVADRDVPERLASDPHLWSGCYSGAMREDRFISAFAAAGLAGTTVIKRDTGPWKTIGGVGFRSITVTAWKPPPPGPDGAQNRIMYLGPFASVTADSGHVLQRGLATAVQAEIAAGLTAEPYSGQVLSLQEASAERPGHADTAAASEAPAEDGCACGPAGCCG
jgi:arsenite methyltransferase